MTFLRQIIYTRALQQAVASYSQDMTSTFRLATSSHLSHCEPWAARNNCFSRWYTLWDDFLGASSSGLPEIAAAGAPMIEAAEHDSHVSPLEWDGLLRAAPKKKVSHSRKAMRAANKGLKDRVGIYFAELCILILDIVHCEAFARPKLQHHLCEHCFSDFARNLKRMNKSSGS